MLCSIDEETERTAHHRSHKDSRTRKIINETETIRRPRSHQTSHPVLPTELLIKVFEFLVGYQSDLYSAALVSVEWNLCATGQLYRYPEFANTIHWAIFIQTLCKNKESAARQPTSKRLRPPICIPTSISSYPIDHPPILLSPVQMAALAAKVGQHQQRQDRFGRILGDYVRGIDLTRRVVGSSRFCVCGRLFGPPVAAKECSVCTHSGKTLSDNRSSNTLCSKQPLQHNTDQIMSLLSGNDDVGSEDDAQSEDGETSSFGISSNNTIDRELPSRGDVITAEKDVCSAKKPLTITASSLILMAKHCPLLEFLCLASTAITDDTLFLETGDYMSTLQSGPRSGLTNIQVTVTEGIEALGRHCPYLGRVWLVGCDWITYREVLTLTKSCRRLRMLDLRHCPRLEGRLCRLYVVLEEEHNSLDANDSTSVNEYDNVEATNHGIWQEKVATPLEFETAPTNVLLGANDAGRGIREGAMEDLFFWVYSTVFFNMFGTTSTSAAALSPLIAGSSVIPSFAAGVMSTATTIPKSTAYSPQAVNDILAMLSSASLSREAPTGLVAFRKWFKAVQDFNLVSYRPLKHHQSQCSLGTNKTNLI